METENKNHNHSRNWLYAIGIIVFIIYTPYYMFRTTNEVGFLGADKNGRQVLIQTLDAELKPNVRVDSDFHDRNIFLRFLIGEPLRTTLRFDYQINPLEEMDVKSLKAYLDRPYQELTANFTGQIFMQNGYEISREELEESLKKNNAETLEDLYAGFGFKRFEGYLMGKKKVSIEIRNTKNVLHVGD